MDHKYFDRILRNKLRRLEEPIEPGAWGLFEQKLDAAGLSDPTVDPSDQAFDEALRGKLDAVEPAYDATHWAMMAEQLDEVFAEPELEDVQLDEIAYENLSQLSPPYNAAHWAMMAERLDAAYSFRNKVYRYKIAEVALMLLLIFTVIQYLPHYKKAKPAKTVKQEQAIATVPQQLEQTVQTSEHSAESPVSVVENKATESSSYVLAELPQPELFAKSSQTDLHLQSTSLDTRIAILQEQATNSVLASLPTLAQNHFSASGTRARPWNFSDVPGAESVQGILTTPRADLPIASIEMLDRLAPAIPEADKNLPTCNGCDQFKKERHWRIGMFASAEANYVMTPYDTKNLLPSYDQFFPGYGGGISIAYSIGKWAFETGGMYSSLSYQPEALRIELRNGSFEEGWSGIGFKEAQLEILKVPLNIRYKYGQLKKWHLYAATGVTAHVAMYQQYNFQKQYKGTPSTNGFGPPPAPSPPSESSPAQRQALHKGYFEGGGLKENTFLTANLGIGVERYLSPRWSIFFQPNYQHQLFSKGFGPNEDRFNTLSTFLGVRATLK